MAMTPRLQSRLLALFAVPECGACHGGGRFTGDLPIGAHEGDFTCPRCSGVGRTLADATREGWPWWLCTASLGCEIPWSEHCEMEPYLPNFAEDDAAAVRLLCEMLWARPEVTIYPPPNRGDDWSVELGSEGEGACGPTLGAALLAALGAGE